MQHGTYYYWDIPDHCPARPQSYRTNFARFNFVEGNFWIVEFDRPLPVEEAGNNDFEVEEDTYIEFPEETTIDGVPFTGVRVKKGVYFVDRGRGDHGSVVVPVEFVK